MGKDKKYCVYVHTCMADGPDYGKVYVGQTCIKPSIRWGLNGQRYKHCHDFYSAICKYGWESFSHVIIKDDLTSSAADELERELIYLYCSNNPEYGYNQTIGGNSLRGGNNPRARSVTVFIAESGEKVGDFPSLVDVAIFTGKDKNSVFRCLSGECKTCGDYICRYSEDVFSISVLPPDQRFRHHAQPSKEKAVDQFDKQGNYLKTFKSIQDAERELGLSRSSVGNAARGKSKSSGGYIWKFHKP